MAYVIFVQPAVLSGSMFGESTGMDFGAVMTATCISAAVATIIMGLYARYPIALAPGMGQNFFFVFTAIPVAAAAGAAEPWRAALGAVFLAGVVFFVISIVGVREKIIAAMSVSMMHALAVGIGLFIAFIGLKNAQIIIGDPITGVKLTPATASPDVVVFAAGFLVAAVLHARRVRGSMLWGIGTSLVTALVLRNVLPVGTSMLFTAFAPTTEIVALPPTVSATAFRMDLSGATAAAMVPVVIIFLFMDVFDTTGTLIGLGHQAGFIKDGRLPRASRAMLSDAAGTVVGAALGTSTVTSYIESAAGIEHGGRTGLTAVTVAILFVLALFFYPVVSMVGSYPPITAPALVLVGVMMARNIVEIDWSDYTESIPAFLVIIGIPLTHSIADGLSMGLLTYPVIKVLSGRRSEVGGMTVGLAVVLLLYFVFVRAGL